MLQVQNIAKSYGDIQALAGVSFDVDQGEIVGLLGPNGAGKSTTIKIITGYLQPDTGSVTVHDLDMLAQPDACKRHIGYLPESAPLYPELSVQGYLLMMAELREIPERPRLARISEAVYATNLQDHLARPISSLSKGFRQRLGVAQAILHKPDLVILDEPTIGLDPTQIVEMRRLIRRLSETSTILFSTHILSEVEALCDRAIILMNGEIKEDARLDELAGSADVVLVLDNPPGGVVNQLTHLPGRPVAEILPAEDGRGAWRVTPTDPAQDLAPAIYELAVQQGWEVRELRSDVRTLEAVFNELAVASDAESVSSSAESDIEEAAS